MSVKVHMPNREVELEEAYELIKIPNGYIKKFTDGTAEYHERCALNLAVEGENGSIFYSTGGINLGNFVNLTFVSVPFIDVQVIDSDYIMFNYSIRYAGKETKGLIYFGSGIKRPSGKVYINYNAYGFWK